MIFDIIGITGVAILLLAYGLLQSEKISSKQLTYPVMNFIGAALITVSLYKDWNLSAFVIEICWMLISVYSMVRIVKKN